MFSFAARKWSNDYARPQKKGRSSLSSNEVDEEKRVETNDFLRRVLEKAILSKSGLYTPELIEAIYERQLSQKDDFLRHSFTDISRLGCRILYIRKQLDNVLGVRPVPIRAFETDTIFFRVPPYYNNKKEAPKDAGKKIKSEICEFHVDAVFISKGDYVKIGDPLFKMDVLSKSETNLSYILVKLEKIHVGYSARDYKYDRNALYRVDDVFCQVGAIVRPDVALFRIDSKRRIVLHNHQLKVVNFIHNLETMSQKDASRMNGGIIRLDPGLGKTLSSIFYTLCAKRPCYPNVDLGQFGFPTLVVCSKSLLSEWLSSGFEKFFNVSYEPRSNVLLGQEDHFVRVLRLHKNFMTDDEIESLCRDTIIRYDFVITTYEFIQSAHKRGYQDECVEYDSSDAAKVVRVLQRQLHESDDSSVNGPGLLFRTPWERVIADESTEFCNPKTKIFKGMMSVYGRYKLCLAAEPILNKVTDVWAQLRFCGLQKPDRPREWIQQVNEIMSEVNKENILSISLKETDIELPPLTHHEHRISLDEFGRNTYEYVKNITKEALRNIKSSQSFFKDVLTLTTRLRQVCIAPSLWLSKLALRSKKNRGKLQDVNDDEENDDDEPKEEQKDEGKDEDIEVDENDELLKGFDSNLQSFFEKPDVKSWMYDENGTAGINSPKMVEVSKLISQFDPSEKVIIFSNYVSALELLKRRLEGEETFCAMIDGQMTIQKRQRILSQFQLDPTLKVLLMTTKVGAFGLNITAANQVIFLDRWWNQTTQIQAIHRVYRPGQKKNVQVHYIITTLDGNSPTIEDRIIELCMSKHKLSEDVFGSVSISSNEGNTTKQLIEML